MVVAGASVEAGAALVDGVSDGAAEVLGAADVVADSDGAADVVALVAGVSIGASAPGVGGVSTVSIM